LKELEEEWMSEEWYFFLAAVMSVWYLFVADLRVMRAFALDVLKASFRRF